MKTNLTLTACLAGFLAITQANAGDVTGKISFKGEAPEPAKVEIDFSVSPDPFCGKQHDTPAYVSFYDIGPEGGLADVFVYLKEGVPEKDYPAPTQPKVLDQVDCIYTPYVMSMQEGQKLLVKNSDETMHNVNVTELGFNQAQIPNISKDFEFVFDKEYHFLRFKCDIHPWMFAYVNVVPHPFHAVSKPDGSFVLKDVPPGEYVVEAHHRKHGKQTATVTVTESGGTADFTFEPAE